MLDASSCCEAFLASIITAPRSALSLVLKAGLGDLVCICRQD